MAIGLNELELLLTLQDSFKEIQKRFNVEKMTADLGVNPQTKILFDRLQEEMPDLTFEIRTIMFSLLLAFADTIAKNNEALAKVIPHIEK